MPTSIDVWQSLFGSQGYRCSHSRRKHWSWCLPALPGTEKACLGLARALVRIGISVALITGSKAFSWEGIEIFPCSVSGGSVLRRNRAASVVWVRCYDPGILDRNWVESRQSILWSGDSTADLSALISRGELGIGSLTELTRILRKFDEIVLVSAWHASDWLESYGVRAGRWIYNYTVDPSPHKVELARKRRPRTIMGTSHPRKSLATFCMSARAATVSGMNLEFITSSSPSLYGQGDLEPVFAPHGGGLRNVGTFRDVVNRYSDCIEFMDSLPACRLYSQLFNTSIFFHPDMSGETGSMALIEAIKCGCIPVVSRLGALPELAEGGVIISGEPGSSGFVSACLDALDSAIEGKYGKLRNSRFSEENIVGEWCRLFGFDLDSSSV